MEQEPGQRMVMVQGAEQRPATEQGPKQGPERTITDDELEMRQERRARWMARAGQQASTEPSPVVCFRITDDELEMRQEMRQHNGWLELYCITCSAWC
eukprot:12408672-Heterocapsa_arctica.AAC.1